MPESQLTAALPSGRQVDLTVSREYINVETLMPPMEKDPDWRFVDRAGHVHTYRSKRWKWVVTGYCGCMYCLCEDEPFAYGEYRCTVCEEVVVPGMRPAPPIPPIPGLLDVRLTVTEENGDGWRIKSTYLVRPEEYKALTFPPGVTDDWVDRVAAGEPISVAPSFGLA